MNDNTIKPNVLVIIGPTAVGKTKLSIELAKFLNGEIISADSMQIYKYMNIGTAKVTPEEMEGIKHYLIDEIYPNEEFSVAQYKETAEKYIDEVLRKNKLPIVVGGTGLYINSLIDNIKFSETICDEEYRQSLSELAIRNENDYLHNMLHEIDPETAKRLHPNDTKRIIRALEVYKCTGNTISYYQSISKLNPPKYNYILIGLSMDREKLYSRIDLRVDKMMDEGLIDEVKKLLGLGYNLSLTSMQAIGYKEVIEYLEGRISFSDAADNIKKGTRHYAKRQFTWFRRNDNIKWFNVTDNDYKNIFKKVHEYIVQNM
jgi:tRNA dimethylallyltransferase